MTRDLRSEVHAWLTDNGPARVADIAAGIRAADQRVRQIVGEVADPAARPAGTDPRGIYYTAREGCISSARLSRPLTHEEKLLAILRDGLPHSHRSLYRHGFMVHSRVAVLRKRGHVISCWREGNDYLYCLLGEAGTEQPGAATTGAVSASPNRTERALGAAVPAAVGVDDGTAAPSAAGVAA